MDNLVFCIGSPARKRAFFRAKVNCKNLFADNDEVVACSEEDGQTLFLLGDPPGELTVWEYYRVNRALISNGDFDFCRFARLVRAACGVKPRENGKIKKLSVFAYRAAEIFSRLTEKTECVAINFDAVEYSSKNAAAIGRFVSAFSEKYRLFVLVSDIRLVLKGAGVLAFAENGDCVKLGGVNTVRVKPESRFIISLREKGVTIAPDCVKKAVRNGLVAPARRKSLLFFRACGIIKRL